jgi:DNA-binding LytR/AlgR family response regulator
MGATSFPLTRLALDEGADPFASALPIASALASRLRVLVLEDERPARNYLIELIEATQMAEVIGAVASANEAREVLEAADGAKVDAAFVDVCLTDAGGERGGLDLVRAMAPSANGPMFVLATAYEQHAVEAFELGVTDYVLKPFQEERIAQCLRRLHERRRGFARARAPEATRIVARRKKSLVFLEPSEIWAFEATDRLTFVHSRHGKFDLDLSLAAIEASFGRTFTRVHRSWLVNGAHIKELERDGGDTRLFVGAGLGDAGEGIHVPVARDRAQTIRETLLANATGLRRL